MRSVSGPFPYFDSLFLVARIIVARKARKASRKPRATVKLYPDHNKNKRAPNGIRSVLLAIQNYWLALQTGKPEDEHLTPAEFCAETGFEKVFRATFARYPKMSGDVEDLPRLLQSLTSGRHNHEFVHLLAFAEFVGIPLSLFLMFSHLVSDELRSIDDGSDFRPVALAFLRKIKFVIEATERQVMDTPPNGRLFVHVYDEFDEPGRQPLMARASALKFWSTIYNSDEAEKYGEEAVAEFRRRDGGTNR
jgi:hypothetical protein